jgi:hypothetical protein
MSTTFYRYHRKLGPNTEGPSVMKDGPRLSPWFLSHTTEWAEGTASGKRNMLDLSTHRATHVDLLVVTYPAAASALGPARATAIMNGYADALGHVPEMQKEVCGYWYSPLALAV